MRFSVVIAIAFLLFGNGSVSGGCDPADLHLCRQKAAPLGLVELITGDAGGIESICRTYTEVTACYSNMENCSPEIEKNLDTVRLHMTLFAVICLDENSRQSIRTGRKCLEEQDFIACFRNRNSLNVQGGPEYIFLPENCKLQETIGKCLGKFVGEKCSAEMKRLANDFFRAWVKILNKHCRPKVSLSGSEILCSVNHCTNGGTCIQDGVDGVSRCFCTHGYDGRTCEEKILCLADTCKNGGACTQDGVGGVFKCSCPQGYEGLVCEKKILCSEGICENGGSCRQDGKNGVFRCACTHGYYGLTCDNKILCLADTCKNGGTCTQDGVGGVFKCSCPQGYEGLACEKTTTITCECEKKCPSHSEKWKDYGGQFCYIIEGAEEVDWNEARNRCFREGGSLANFHSAEEVNRVSCQVSGGGRYYIGLRRNVNGTFEWTDKSALDFQNWDTDEPNNEHEMCVFMYGDGRWNDISCSIMANYICSATKSV